MNPAPSQTRLLIVGWDAADWQFISPLLDTGLMPHLARFVERGVMGNLASLRPMLSPICWTSIATGRHGDAHGVCSFLEPVPGENALRPVSSFGRQTKALWNIATQAGRRVHVVNWYATHPAEPINGVCVSDQFQHVDPATLPAWPLPAGAVHPADLADAVADLRVKPTALAFETLSHFIPQLAGIDLSADPRPAAFARTLARTASVHAVATNLVAENDWDLACVFYDALDVAGHMFMPFHPPAVPGASPLDARRYAGVMTNLYRFFDTMFGRLIALAGDDTTVMLVSDHGFHNGPGRPAYRADGDARPEEETAVLWHRPLGVFALAGPNVKHDERVSGATLLDITPTALAVLNLPPGRDMPGRVLEDAFTRPPALERIASWETVDGFAGQHAADARIDPIASHEAVRQLVELGYLVDTGDTAALAARVIAERSFNLATIFAATARPGRAIDALKPLVAAHPENARYAEALARALVADKRPSDAAELLERFVAGGMAAPPDIWLALADASLAVRPARALEIAQAHAPAASPALQTAWGFFFRAAGDASSSAAAFSAALAALPDSAEALYGLGALHFDAGDHAAALDFATRAVARLHAFPAAHHLIASAHAAAGDVYAAQTALDVTLALDPAFRPAHALAAALAERRGDLPRLLRHRRALEGHAYTPAASAAF